MTNDHGLDYGNHPLYTQSHNNPILHTYYLFRLINDKYIKKSDITLESALGENSFQIGAIYRNLSFISSYINRRFMNKFPLS